MISELLIYDFDTILIATSNFSITKKLGQGGFGPVYKGILEEGKEIIVKRLASSSGQGIDEFKNEMLLISNLQHKNLVRIMGCCINDDEKLLIYEFMPNKSLDTFLFDPTRRAVLDWDTRFNIIQGVARGLLYLLHDSYLKVLIVGDISNQKNTSFCLYCQQLGFLAYAWNLWNEGRGLELVNEVLGDSYSSSEVMRCVHIGLLCVQDNGADRPTMGEIVLMPSSDTDGPQPRPQCENTFSTNEATITVMEGR